jgi:hypothetical protein
VFISEQGYIHNRLKQRKVRQIFIATKKAIPYLLRSNKEGFALF